MAAVMLSKAPSNKKEGVFIRLTFRVNDYQLNDQDIFQHTSKLSPKTESSSVRRVNGIIIT